MTLDELKARATAAELALIEEIGAREDPRPDAICPFAEGERVTVIGADGTSHPGLVIRNRGALWDVGPGPKCDIKGFLWRVDVCQPEKP